MIDGLFGGTNYLAAKKGLDACVVRQQAIARNIANIETPGYRRVDLDSSFQSQFSQAIQSGQSSSISSLQPGVSIDAAALPKNADGNSVTLVDELLSMQENGMQHAVQAQLVTGRLARLRSAITGRSA